MASTRHERLTPLQKAFVREFVSNPDARVRCNATLAYRAAGGKAHSDAAAQAVACQLLHTAKVQRAITAYQVHADAQLLTTLVDWKTAATEAQPTLLNLARGYLPDGQRMATQADAAIGHVILAALKEIMDRGYPKQLYLKIDARASLARLLGVPLESLPDTMDEEEDR